MARTSPRLFVCLAIGSVAVLLQIIGLATTYWTSNTTKYGTVHSGLWEMYVLGRWVYLGFTDDQTNAVRAFAILAMLSGVGSVLLMVLYMFVQRIKMVWSAILSATAAVCIVISIATFTSFRVEVAPYLSWSFYLCVVAMVMFVVNVGVIMVQIKREGARSVYESV